jgi:predicted AlkP superfamily pyrophosphatase or phosphodiesterase
MNAKKSCRCGIPNFYFEFMKHKNLLMCTLVVFTNVLIAQPKLVVGIVVDQMRADYIQRYWPNFSDGGFKRLSNEGFSCLNTHYHYVPTYTGPGHASIYTGSSPSVHGIIGNNWFQRDEQKVVYCTEDALVNTVGSQSNAGKMSPRRMLAPTIGDELRMSSQKQSKVIALSLKDRAAILPAGHAANGAYWYDAGSFISSTWYMQDLPQWVRDFNARKRADSLLAQDWNMFLSPGKYCSSRPDDQDYEGLFKGETKPVFPHKLKSLMSLNGGLNMIRATPFGNTLVKEFAMAAIEGEQLGRGNATDFLAISFSSTDYVGHQYGIDAIETEDTYIRLDLEIRELLNFLDQKVGKGKYLLFLTADHAAVRAPSLLLSEKIPAGHFDADKLKDSLNAITGKVFGAPLVLAFENQQVYLNHKAISSAGISSSRVLTFVKDYLLTQAGVIEVYFADEMISLSGQKGLASKTAAGFFRRRSGDLMVQLAPGWAEHSLKGTTHGAPYVYDTHVPLIFFGSGIPSGKTWEECFIDDIAPSVAALLGISSPGGATGKVIPKLFQP